MKLHIIYGQNILIYVNDIKIFEHIDLVKKKKKSTTEENLRKNFFSKVTKKMQTFLKTIINVLVTSYT